MKPMYPVNLAWLLISICWFNACSNLGGPEDAPTVGGVSGTLIDAQTGLPVSGAAIASDPPTRSVTSDAEGRFSLPGCPAGPYRLIAAKPGYARASIDVIVVAGSAAEAGITLAPSVGALAGKVLDRDRRIPLAGALIKTRPATMTVVTDSDGGFAIEGLLPSGYEVIASRSAYVEASVTVTVFPGKITTANVQLEALDSLAAQAKPPESLPTTAPDIKAPAIAAEAVQGGSSQCPGPYGCPSAMPGWSLVYPVQPGTVELTGIASLDDSRAWACGSEKGVGFIIRFDGATKAWVREGLPEGIRQVGGLHMISPSLGYATAVATGKSPYRLHILRYDGTGWTVFRSRETPFSQDGWDIHTVSEMLVFASFGDDGVVYAITPEGWRDQGVRGRRMDFRNREEGYVTTPSGQAWRFDGSGWRAWETGSQLEQTSVPSGPGVFALHRGASGDSLLEYATGGIRLRSLAISAEDPLESARTLCAWDATHVWIATSRGAMLVFDGYAFLRTVVPGATGFKRLFMHGIGGGFALAANGIYRYH